MRSSFVGLCVGVWARRCLLYRDAAVLICLQTQSYTQTTKPSVLLFHCCLLGAPPALLLPSTQTQDQCSQSAGWSQWEQENKRGGGGRRRWIRAVTVTWGFDMFVSIRCPSSAFVWVCSSSSVLLLCVCFCVGLPAEKTLRGSREHILNLKGIIELEVQEYRVVMWLNKLHIIYFAVRQGDGPAQ